MNQKRSGTDFERKLVKYLNRLSKYWKWKRIAGSGALGTNLGEPSLTGDVVGTSDYVPFKIRVEAKFGYGGSKQLTLKKEWMDKILSEAKSINDIPVLIGRFKGARSGVEEFAVMDINTFVTLIDYISEILSIE